MKKKTASYPGGKTAPLPSRTNTEKDPDDLVHSGDDSLPSQKAEEDPDDAVHQSKRPVDGQNSLEDPDDLVHDAQEDEDR